MTPYFHLGQQPHIKNIEYMHSLKRKYLEHRHAINDAIVLGTAAICTFVCAIYFEMAELFFEFSRKHEDWELDDIILSFLLIFSFYLMIFAIRRWKDTILLLKKAYTDSLTEVYNRRKCTKTLFLEVTIAKKFNRTLSIIAIDIDHFKRINDVFGHAAGDHVLKTLSGLVKNEIRGADTLFRIGGEEFLIISTETDSSGATRLAERLRSLIEKYPFGKIGGVTASFGVAEYESGDNTDTLFQRADKNLYEAKETGRNRVVS